MVRYECLSRPINRGCTSEILCGEDQHLFRIRLEDGPGMVSRQRGTFNLWARFSGPADDAPRDGFNSGALIFAAVLTLSSFWWILLLTRLLKVFNRLSIPSLISKDMGRQMWRDFVALELACSLPSQSTVRGRSRADCDG
jgi:hypothetical protein